MKIFFSLLILYLFGALLMHFLLITHRIRLVDKSDGTELSLTLWFKICIIVAWPIVILLVIIDWNK